MYELLLAFSVLLCISIAVYYVRSGLFSLFHPITYYITFHALVFVLRPILAYYLKYDALYYVYRFMPSQSDKMVAILVANLGFVAFSVAALWTGNVKMEFKNDRFVLMERQQLNAIFWWVIAICAPVALYGLSKSASGDAGGLFMDRSTGISINTTSIGYITDAELMLVPITAIFAWMGRFSLLRLVPLVLYIIYRASTGSRGPLIAAIFVFGLFWLYDRRILFPKASALLLFVVAASLFRVVGDDRGAMFRQIIGRDTKDAVFKEREIDKQRVLESMDYGNLEFLEYLVYVIPNKSGTYDYFLDNFQVFTEPVPRVLWKGKPIGEPFRRIALFDWGSPFGMTRSLPGEGWYALGWLGVAIWCALWGGMLGSLYRKFVESSQTTLQVSSYLVFTPMLILFYRDGQLITLVKQAGIYMMPIVMWAVLAKLLSVPTAAYFRKLSLMDRPALGKRGTNAMPGRSPSGHAQLPAAVMRRRVALAQPMATPLAD